jgi:hypothetical protein
MKKPAVTKKQFELYLNAHGPEQGNDRWIIGGRIRMIEMCLDQYGTALRKYDPVIFGRAYNQYLRML